jgi:hypothetical protein
MSIHTVKNSDSPPISTEKCARAQALLTEFQTNHPMYAHLKLLAGTPDDDYMLAARACRLFGVEVVVYEPIETLHGVTEGNCVLLSGYQRGARDYRPLWTAGHETSHVLGSRRPVEHGGLVSYIMNECILPEAFDRRSAIEKLAQGYLGLMGEKPVPVGWSDVVNEEVVADVAGSLWQDPSFWADIHELDVSPSRRALYAEIIARLKVEREAPYRSWTSDSTKARAKFVDYMLLFVGSVVEPV